jgi:hypothetical protein
MHFMLLIAGSRRLHLRRIPRALHRDHARSRGRRWLGPETPRPPPRKPPPPEELERALSTFLPLLTDREKEVLTLLRQGSNATQTASVLAGRASRTELLHVLMLPDFERADRIGEFWGYPESRAFAELLIDCEEDRKLRAVPVGMLREAERR